jgi:hypothetical protein
MDQSSASTKQLLSQNKLTDFCIQLHRTINSRSKETISKCVCSLNPDSLLSGNFEHLKNGINTNDLMISLQRHNTENSKQIFAEKELRGLSPNFPHSCVCERFYMFPGSVCLFCCRKICGPILGIYESLTDTWMWKLGLRQRNSFSGNT